ncbi:MAG: phosphatase PAP2 family protein [Terracidiphilus sp.]|jgi:membrane-associated phospholipid phosphatase
MSGKTATRNWLLAFAVAAIIVVVCIEYVDRPAAEFFDQYLRHATAWAWIDRALAPLDLTVAIALLFVFGCWIWATSGHLLPSWTRTPLLCAWAAVWATVASFVLKRIFGRACPDPVFIQNHIYGFRPLDSAPHWQSFPSGTAAISAAIVSALWILQPRWRVPGTLIVGLLSVAVVVTNFHWVGDVIAGTVLGTFIGWMTVRVLMPCARRE